MPTISILGANGRLSRTVAKAFLAAGWHVKAISRSGAPMIELAGAEFVAADALDQGATIKACEGTHVVFNGLNPIYTEWDAKAMPMARNALAAAKASKATMLFPGNVYGFGAGMPLDLKESTPEVPTTSKGKIRIEMEALFRTAAERDGVQIIILRAGDFFGGTEPGTWLDLGMATKLAKGVFTHPGNPDRMHAFAYLPDLADAFVLAAQQRDRLPRFETIHFEGHNVTTRDLQRATEQALGHPLKSATMPWTFIRLAGLIWPMGREIARMAYLWDVPHRLKSEKFHQLLGDTPHTPLTEAMKKALEDQGLIQDKVVKAA